MRILVTGATGFVGQHLINRLTAKTDHQIICLVRSNSSYVRLSGNPKIEVRTADLLDPSSLEKAVNDIDIIYHLAGSMFAVGKKEMFDVNCKGTLNLYLALKNTPVRNFIYLSSIAAVGPSPNKLDENVIPRPSSNYGKSKLCAEKALHEYFPSVNKPLIIIRSPLIYGKRMSSQSRLFELAKKVLDGSFRFVGHGDNHISFCHIDPLTDFLAKAPFWGLPGCEIFHVADEKNYTLKELVELLADVLEVPPPSKHITPLIAFPVSNVCKLLNRFRLVQDAITPERLRELTGNWQIDTTKAKSYGFDSRDGALDSVKQMIASQIMAAT